MVIGGLFRLNLPLFFLIVKSISVKNQFAGHNDSLYPRGQRLWRLYLDYTFLFALIGPSLIFTIIQLCGLIPAAVFPQ